VRAIEGLNGRGDRGWRPPSPPAGHGRHHYYFHAYALDLEPTALEPDLTAPELRRAADGHVLGVARIVGTYERPGEPG
jgi:phosphatidylethanolamine-binding protein (PEBP) family uncharacterized protein